MATITANISSLNVLQKTEKGANLITKGTTNPLVPGNGPALATFTTAQGDLITANAAVQEIRDSLKQAIVVRNEAEAIWDGQCMQLAAFTQAATGGDEVAILSSGFDVRRANSPKPPVGAPGGLTVSTNGAPGVSKVRWYGVDGAVSYLVECSPEPITEKSWVQVDAPTKTNCEVSGAEPGKVCWFRVAAVSSDGKGPWTLPVQRPVM